MTGPVVELRLANDDDPAWVVARHGAIYADEFGFTRDFEVDIAAKLDAFLGRDDPFRRLWIAEVDGGRAGSIAISKMAEDTAFLNFVLVEPAQRGKGIAQALMDTALGHARDHGVPYVRLETYSRLTSARRLYAGYRFSIETVTPGIEKYGQRFDREYWIRAI